MTSKKNRSSTDLKSIAGELEALAAGLRRNRLQLGGGEVEIGEPLFLKTKQKLKDGKAYYTLSFKVPVLAAPERKAGPAEDNAPFGRTSAGKNKLRHGSEPQGQHPEGKKLKKEIARLWKEFGKSLAEEKIPAEQLGNNLLKKCRDYRQFTEPSWHEQWLACTNLLEQSVVLAASGNLAAARSFLEQVDQRIKACHQKYK